MSSITERFPELLRKKSKVLETKSVPLPGGYGGLGVLGGLLSNFSNGIRLPGADLNYTELAGDPLCNAIVRSVVTWISTQYSQARPVVKRLDVKTGKWEVDPKHRLAKLLDRPNPSMSGRMMRRAIAQDLAIYGNAYIVIERGGTDGTGPIAGLSWISAQYVRAIFTVGSAVPIDRFEYQSGTDIVKYKADQVIHLKLSVDPTNPRMGASPVPAVLREIAADASVSTMYAAVARNRGAGGYMISPGSPEAELDDATRKLIRDQFDLEGTGENQGKPFVSSKSLSIMPMADSIDDMAVDVIRQQIQARVCSVYGVDCLVLGLNTDSATYANKESAERNAWHNKILPDLDLLAEDISCQLLPLLESNPDQCRLEWDTAAVVALQEDANAKSTRANTAIRTGGIQINEYRDMIGLPPIDTTSSGVDPNVAVGTPSTSSVFGGIADSTAPPKETTNA